MDAAHRDHGEVTIRRKNDAFPEIQLLVRKSFEIVMPGKLDRRMVGREGLHDNRSLQFAATGTPLVVVLVNSKPLVLPPEALEADALIEEAEANRSLF